MIDKAKSLTIPTLMVEGADQCADLFYGSGFMPVDPVVFLDGGTRRTLVVPMLEFGRAREEAKGVEVVLPEDIKMPKKRGRSIAHWALALLRREGIRRVRVGSFFPAAVMRVLERNGVRVVVEKGSLYPGRAVKRADEVEKISDSQRAAVSAMRRARAILGEAEAGADGRLRWQGRVLDSERLRTEIDIELLRQGCHARDTIVAGGAQAADPHERGHGPLRVGESIVIDIFPRHKRSGYWGDITRTFCKGKPSPALARMYKAVLEAQQLALDMIKPGVRADKVHQAVCDYFVERGYETTVKDGVVRGFFHGTGHGVGLDIHEAPSISRIEHVFRVGEVVTVEPGLYDPDTGGVRIEDTVVVEKGGVRILSAFPKKFGIG
jgi:Xaa-Pro aminopeptidase